jgi:hypothetical protein
MTWNKKAGKTITKQKADEMVDKYQKAHKDGTRSIYFDKEVVQELLNTEGTEGVKIFFAKNDEDQNTVVLYPVDENGRIIEISDARTKVVKATALNVGAPCPPYC